MLHKQQVEIVVRWKSIRVFGLFQSIYPDSTCGEFSDCNDTANADDNEFFSLQ